MRVQIEPKRIDRLSNVVETPTFAAADFIGLYVQRVDEEFGETYWEWVSDHPKLDSAYARAVQLGDATPTIRAE